MTIFKDLTQIFKVIQGFKYKVNMASSKFRKLSNFSFMRSEKFRKVDYDILYKTVELKTENGQMDFLGFVFAIETIASRLHPD